MSTTLRFRQHEEFQRAAVHMAAAGACAGLLAHALGSATSPWAPGLVAAAAVFGALAPALRWQPSELAARAGLLALAAAALVLMTRTGQPTAGLGLFAVLFGGAIGWGLRGHRLLVTVAVSAAIALVLRHVLHSVVTAQELAFMPAWLVATGAGSAAAFVAVFALVPRHLDIERDEVSAAYEALAGSLTGEVRELVDRGHGLWTRTDSEVDGSDMSSRGTLKESVLRLFEVARRWQAVEAAGTEITTSALAERIAGLEQRIAGTEDEVTRAQYEQARAALAEQLRYIKDIGVSRERVLARMHNYLAAMERLRMAVINLRSTHASRESDVQPLVSSLEQLGADMDSCSEALVEADRLATR